jgi:hypothetical protein
MKQRLLVMNGQRIVQAEEDGAWKNQKVDKAGALPPGFYNLHAAQKADTSPSQRHDGLIVHTDDTAVFQQVGKNKNLVMHDRANFDKVPVIGSAKSITYDDRGKAVAAPIAVKLSRGHSR